MLKNITFWKIVDKFEESNNIFEFITFLNRTFNDDAETVLKEFTEKFNSKVSILHTACIEASCDSHELRRLMCNAEKYVATLRAVVATGFDVYMEHLEEPIYLKDFGEVPKQRMSYFSSILESFGVPDMISDLEESQTPSTVDEMMSIPGTVSFKQEDFGDDNKWTCTFEPFKEKISCEWTDDKKDNVCTSSEGVFEPVEDNFDGVATDLWSLLQQTENDSLDTSIDFEKVDDECHDHSCDHTCCHKHEGSCCHKHDKECRKTQDDRTMLKNLVSDYIREVCEQYGMPFDSDKLQVTTEGSNDGGNRVSSISISYIDND